MITINDIRLITLNIHYDNDGFLVPIDFINKLIPFNVKRIFYVSGVHDQNNRGKHSHYTTKQFLICISGKLIVHCDDGITSKEWTLSAPNVGLYIPELIWDEQYYSTPDTVMLCLANTPYMLGDYIQDYDVFKKIKRKL